MKIAIIAIDFDGTIVEDRHPEIGKIKPGAKENINKLKGDGYTILIWTCRTGQSLLDAISFLIKVGIKFDHVNTSCPVSVKMYGGLDTRKVFADMYIDDKGLLTPLPHWDDIYEMVHERLPTYSDRVIAEGQL